MRFLNFRNSNKDIDFDLNVLKRDSQRYNMFLYQHGSDFYYDEQRIGNTNPDLDTFKSLITLVDSKNPDLFLTPEYSIPFGSITQILNKELPWPEKGKLWAICGESINYNQLNELDALNSEEISIVHETISRPQGNFFDPLFYIFRGTNKEKDVLVVLIQFKTKHMGVWSQDTHIERDNLIEGNDIYILNNKRDSINLFTFICSEAADFKNFYTAEFREQWNWQDMPFLILNPQFNPKPNHKDFINFRKIIFENPKKEIISLNWNNYTTVKGHTFLEYNTSRSGFYIESSGVEFDHFDRIRENHKKGIYYFNNKQNRHTYLLNSNINLYLIANLSVGLTGISPMNRRDGPEVLEAYVLNEGSKFNIVTEPVNDHHLEFIKSVNCNNDFLSNPDVCVGDKEILICLSAGDLGSTVERKWYKFNLLNNINLNEDTELTRRVTIAEDLEEDSIKARGAFLDAIGTLDLLLTQQDKIPDSIANLRGKNVKVAFSKDSAGEQYRYNVVDEFGKSQQATVVYVGSLHPLLVEKKFKKYQTLFDHNNKDRVVIYYKLGNEICIKTTIQPANIFNPDSDMDNESYLRH